MIEPLSKLFVDPARVASVMTAWSVEQANATDGKVPAWTPQDVDSILQGTLTPLEVSPSLLISLANVDKNRQRLDPKLFCREMLGDMFNPRAQKSSTSGNLVDNSQVCVTDTRNYVSQQY